MTPIHVDLSDIQPGEWAELRPAPWGLLKEATKIEDGDWLAFSEHAVSRLVTRWSVHLPDGREAPLPRELTTAQRDDLDARIMLRLSARAGSLLRDAKTDPNSDADSSASSSETPSPTAS